MFILIPIAFISGILTVFSPCVLPILPIILASGIDGNTKRIKGVIAGLIVSFTIASLLLATLVKALGIPADTIRSIAVLLLVVLGASMLFPILWEKIQAFIEQHWRAQPLQNQDSSFGAGFLTGVSLGIVWTPCIGPVIATVATLAAVNQFSVGTVLITLFYALGTGVPLYFVAKGGKSFTQKLTIFKQNNQLIRQIFGVIVLLTALFIWTGLDKALQAWTLQHLPSSWTQLATTFEEKAHINTQLQGLKQENELPKAQPGETVIRHVDLQRDFTGAKISPLDIEQGCLSQDCIPSIDNPKFDLVKDGSWLRDEDVIFVINHKGVERAYPQRILNWHEIVNDTVAGDPIAITFCPLCGSAVASERKVNGIITQFGISGGLHNNDLIMYDRYEGNLWQQVTGEALVGPAARRNEVLKPILLAATSWGKWKKEHQNAQVLSKDTGFSRNYDQYPYGTYEQDNELYFGVNNQDKILKPGLPIKTVVYGIQIGSKSKAYPVSVFDKNPAITDTINDTSIKLEKTTSGEIKVINLQTNEEIITIRLFWFAWAAFHPDTQLYSQ